ncbi:hypothetical protein MKZ01_06360 [Lysinibacillus endophyticus]|uniref:hypothetical protein n=1 Tax=Ureibacillus endophyticus TaxID=1978490 RepID=UPI0031370BF3
MEELLKQLLTEIQGFKAEISNRFDQVDNQFNQVEERFDEVDNRFSQVDNRFDEVDNRLNQMDMRLGNLENGQEELKHLIKHNTTLMTENLTNIRRDFRERIQDTEADVNLLFKEVEENKRKINQIDERIKY